MLRESKVFSPKRNPENSIDAAKTAGLVVQTAFSRERGMRTNGPKRLI
jgi:hypothetical protein